MCSDRSSIVKSSRLCLLCIIRICEEVATPAYLGYVAFPHINSTTEGSFRNGSTTIRLRTFRLRHFVYRHFVYYCIPAYRTVIHPTSVSANHYFHQLQLLLTL